MPAWTVAGDGIVVAVRVTPRGGRDAIGAGTADHLAVRLAAAPIDGAANAALIGLVARAFAVSKSAVTIRSGESARLKRLHIAGSPTALAETAASLYGPSA